MRVLVAVAAGFALAAPAVAQTGAEPRLAALAADHPMLLGALLFGLASLLVLTGMLWRRGARLRQANAELERVLADRDRMTRELPVGLYTLVDTREGDWHVQGMSDRGLELLGVTRAAIMADAYAAFANLHPDDRDRVLNLNEQARRDKRPFVVEARFQIDACLRWLRIESWPSPYQNDFEWSGCISDVTDRHEAESRFQALFEQSPLAIMLHDVDSGEVLDANRAAWESYGLDSLASLQQRYLWAEPPYSEREALAHIRAAAEGRVQRFEWCSINAQGQPFWELVSVMPVVIEGRLRVFSTAIDITELRAARQRFRAIFEQSPVAILVQDAVSGEVLDANEQAWLSYGFDNLDDFKIAADSGGLSMEPGSPSGLRKMREAVASGGGRLEWPTRHADGHTLWFDVTLTPIDLDGRDCVLAVCLDVTQRRATEQQLRDSEARFRRVLQDIDGVAVQGYGLDGQVHYWNRASEALYGYSEAEAQEGNLLDLIIPPEMREDVKTNLQRVAEGGDIGNGELELMRKDGSRVPVYSSHTVLRAPGSPPELFCVDIDLSERKAHEQALNRMANYDNLTGLPNRRLMGELIEQMMTRTRRSQGTFALCYLDLDEFKPINDRHGHDVGDQVLMVIARRLRRLVRGSDLVARLGGDEFVIVLDGIGDGPELDRRLGFLLDGVARPIEVDRLQLQVHGSVGVTLFPKDSGDPDALLRHADQAMYRAKAQGRNRYSLFDIELEANVRRRRTRLLEIEHGLDQDQFRLYYQPKIDLATDRVVGFEGLVRWHRPDGELFTPMCFLPDLDRSDLERRFGETMIRQALGQIVTWSSAGVEVTISVNISGPHLLSAGFVDTLAGLLAEHADCPPERLALEIVESAAVSDLERAVTVLTEVRNLGVQVSLDDFGTGYSSLSHLRTLPVDEVKIDQSFVRDMLDDINDRSIVQSVISLAAAFSLRVVAEGVETQAHVDALRELGCGLVQGYAFARPMPVDEVTDWLNSQSSSTSS
ncbi:MAG: EAL domain-containing protein [Wenzhouxiangella sp.]|jgi:diguanylate cyclase (GGDEF)-like protein/PAS domain S-box-containing protein|nr:EAL domain-containing protein [Wenzhouxiangella sp.]